MQYPDYDTTADIEVINNNIKKLVQNAEEQDTQIKSKEPIINKKTGFNLDKTDLTENDTNKVFSAKGAFDLKTWLVSNYTTLMNNIRENLTNMINTKTPHGGYNKSSQDLKNEIDTKVSKSGDVINGKVSVDSSFTPLISLAIGDQDTGFNAIEDGNVEIRGNNRIHGNITQAGVNFVAGRLTIGGEHPYRPGNKPTPSDIGAISKEGDGTINGRLFVDRKHPDTNLPAISLAIGDNDSGFDWLSDGEIRYVVNGVPLYNLRSVYHTLNKPTKGDVGLDLVNNWDASSAVNDPSNSKYATVGAVKKAYDKGTEALGVANSANTNADGRVSKEGGRITGKVSVDSSFTPLISLAIGDQDTGFNAIEDGNVEIRGNNRIHGNITQAGVNFVAGRLTIDGEHPYRPGNKPTPSDIGALSKEGNGSINGRLFVDNKNSPNQPAISLAIGDNDSGFDWLSDGTIRYVSNGVARYNMYNVFAIETCSVEYVGGDTYIMKYPNGTMFLSMSVVLTEQVGGTYNQRFTYPASFKEGTTPNVVGKNVQFCATHIAGVEGADNRGFNIVGNRSMNVRIQAMGVYK